MEQVEEVLYSYRSLKRASKRLRRRAYTINDGMKSNYKAADVIPGRVSAVAYSESLQDRNVVDHENLIERAKRVDELARTIKEDVEELKHDDPETGEEMIKIIKLRYFKMYSNNKIEIELAISDRTLYRRRTQALELLKEKGLHLFYGEIMSMV